MKLLTTGATQLDGPGRLLKTRETVLEDKRNSPGGAIVRLLTTGATGAGCTREVVYNMRISAGGAERKAK